MRYVILLMVLALSVLLPHHLCFAQENQQYPKYQAQPQSYHNLYKETSKLEQADEQVPISKQESYLSDVYQTSNENRVTGGALDELSDGQIDKSADAETKSNVAGSVPIENVNKNWIPMQELKEGTSNRQLNSNINDKVNAVRSVYDPSLAQMHLPVQNSLRDRLQPSQQNSAFQPDETKFMQAGNEFLNPKIPAEPQQKIYLLQQPNIIPNPNILQNSASPIFVYKPDQVDLMQQMYKQTNQYFATTPRIEIVQQVSALPVQTLNVVQQVPNPASVANIDPVNQVNYGQPGVQQIRATNVPILSENSNVVIATTPANPMQQETGNVIQEIPKDKSAPVVGEQNREPSQMANKQLCEPTSGLYQKVDIVRSVPRSRDDQLQKICEQARSKEASYVDEKESKLKDVVKDPINYRTHDRRSMSIKHSREKLNEDKFVQDENVLNYDDSEITHDSESIKHDSLPALQDDSQLVQPDSSPKNAKLVPEHHSSSPQVLGHSKHQINQSRLAACDKQQTNLQTKIKIPSVTNAMVPESDHRLPLKTRQANEEKEPGVVGPNANMKQPTPPNAIYVMDNHVQKKSMVVPDTLPYQQPVQFEDDLPVWHESLDNLYRPVNSVQPVPRNLLDVAVQRSVDQQQQPGPDAGNQPPPPPAVPPPPAAPPPPPAPQSPPAPPAPPPPQPPDQCVDVPKYQTRVTSRFEIPQVSYASVSPKQSQLHRLVQQLYQAEAQVQLEAQQIQQAQAVASAAQQTLEEAANNVKVISAALQSAQESVASAAIRAHIAQLQLAAHDQMLFTARQNVDSLSAQMVGLQAEVGISYDVHHLNVPELLGRLQQPLSNEQTPTPIPTLIPLSFPNSANPENIRSYAKLIDDADIMGKRTGESMSRQLRGEPESKLRGVPLANDPFIVDPTLVLNGLRARYRDRRDLMMLLDELQKPLENYYKREKK